MSDPCRDAFEKWWNGFEGHETNGEYEYQSWQASWNARPVAEPPKQTGAVGVDIRALELLKKIRNDPMLTFRVQQVWEIDELLTTTQSAPSVGSVPSVLELEQVILPIWYGDSKSKPYDISNAIHALLTKKDRP